MEPLEGMPVESGFRTAGDRHAAPADRIGGNQLTPSTAPRICTITIFRIVIDGKIIA